MNKFIFELQRFAETINLNADGDTQQSTLKIGDVTDTFLKQIRG